MRHHHTISCLAKPDISLLSLFLCNNQPFRSESLLKAVYTSKFVKPSRIQEYALPYLLRDPPEHLIAQSQSGTGKTAAFALAVLSRIKYENVSTQVYIVPAHELLDVISILC